MSLPLIKHQDTDFVKSQKCFVTVLSKIAFGQIKKVKTAENERSQCK